MEKRILELQPGWYQVGPQVMKGLVSLYVDTLVDGITHQTTHEVPIRFMREAGDTRHGGCVGRLTIEADDKKCFMLIGETAMLYGNEGTTVHGKVHDGKRLLTAEFDTDASDGIFMSAGQLSWGEVSGQRRRKGWD